MARMQAKRARTVYHHKSTVCRTSNVCLSAKRLEPRFKTKTSAVCALQKAAKAYLAKRKATAKRTSTAGLSKKRRVRYAYKHRGKPPRRPPQRPSGGSGGGRETGDAVRLAHVRAVAKHASGLRFQPSAVRALREVAEAHFASVLKDTKECAIHTERKTIQLRDLWLVRRLRGECSVPWWS